MKLTGVELLNYACFEHRFIPLETGILLLAGKNNSGKTSILRALEALCGLPFKGQSKIENGVFRYIRETNPYPKYDMNVYFSYEEQDATFLKDLIDPNDLKNAQNVRWKFSFTIIEPFATIIINGVDILRGNSKTRVLYNEPNAIGLVRPCYDSLGRPTGVELFRPSGSGPSLVDGRTISWYEQPIFSALLPLMNTKLVSAHRVVRHQLQLQALTTLSENADSLAPFLDTILSNDREKFDSIEKVVISIFPEFKFVNPEKSQNGVSITLTQKDSNKKIPLANCGTGVEQVLAIATFVLTAKPGTIILLDEPHSYLHPIAERQIVDFLLAHPEHRYVIATHSAILINSVAADSILRLGNSDISQNEETKSHSTAQFLRSLGYKNSDLLFNDRLILVEGESDQEILPILLSCNPLISKSGLDKIGFPVMDGEGKLRGRDKQRSLLYWEKFLSQLGENTAPRVYLFDGGCIQEDRKLLEKSNYFSPESAALLRFLKMNEIENYLLVPQAILDTIIELCKFEGISPEGLNLETIEKKIKDILSDYENKKIFPNGKGDDPKQTAKGSVVLDKLFSDFDLRYEKRKTGRLIATKITEENQPLLNEIWVLFPREFLPYEV